MSAWAVDRRGGVRSLPSPTDKARAKPNGSNTRREGKVREKREEKSDWNRRKPVETRGDETKIIQNPYSEVDLAES